MQTISGDIERALDPQVRRTAAAIAAGTPDAAVPEDQKKARARYAQATWHDLADDITPEGFVGADDMIWANFLARGARIAAAVGRISWRDGTDEERANGTGFLVSGGYVMTNHHVLGDPDEAKASVLELDYEYDVDGRERRARPFSLDPGTFWITNPDEKLDYSLVAVGTGARGERIGPRRPQITLIEDTGKASNGEPLNVVHHPAGRRKSITIRASYLQAVEGDHAAYTGDTLNGSSGAPIFNDQWELVALHFGGRAQRDADGQVLSRDGTAWEPSMGAAEKAYEYNVGLRVSRIVRDLRDQGVPTDVINEIVTPGGRP